MKRLLIVVDYQNDFVDGALGFEGAELLDKPIAEKISEYRAAGDVVAFTYDTHHRDYMQTQEGLNLTVPHCIEGTEGHKLYGETALMARDMDEVYYKPTFGSSELFARLSKAQASAASLGREPVEVIVSNMCVLSNAVIARSACPNVQVIVDAACTAAPDPKLNEEALDVLEALQVSVINRQKSASLEG